MAKVILKPADKYQIPDDVRKQFEEVKAKYAEVFRSSSYRYFVEEVNRVSKIVAEVMKPVIAANQKMRELSEPINKMLTAQEGMHIVLPIHNNLRTQHHYSDEKIEEIIKKTIKITTQKLEKQYAEDEPTILTFNRDNNLVIKGDGKHVYPIQKNSLTHKILLIIDGEFIITKTIMKMTGSQSIQSISKEKAKINNKAKYFLQIKDELIEGKRGEGYRLNQKYNIEI